MNYDQITGILRAVVPALLAYFVAKGYLTQSVVGDVTAAVVTIGSAIWSVANNTSGKTIGS